MKFSKSNKKCREICDLVLTYVKQGTAIEISIYPRAMLRSHVEVEHLQEPLFYRKLDNREVTCLKLMDGYFEIL